MAGAELGNRKKVLLFNYFTEFTTGITTKNLGNMKLFRKNGILPFLSQLVGIRPFVIIKPEHSDRVVTITECPPVFVEYIRYECDAIIYNGERIFAPALMSMTGDCPIILLAAEVDDKSKMIMAIIHSGWRGTSLNITSKTIKKIKKLGGHNIKAIVWPGICGECYKVGDGLYDKFPAKYFNGNYLNLQAHIEDELNHCQVNNYYIIKGFCPHCKGKKFFFSHRRGYLERNGVFIAPKF